VVHDRLNIEDWISRFPLAQARQEARLFVEQRRLQCPEDYQNEEAVKAHIALMSPGGGIVCSPGDLALAEQLRREAFAGQQIQGIPTDIFVFGRGEPKHREATKLGGLPYWPASQDWPCSAEGRPLAFIGQICFADSRDIVGKLPGDVLLIFGPRDSENLGPDESELKFFWREMGDSDLIGPGGMPQCELVLPPLYGVICRTLDYPGAGPLFGRYRKAELLASLEGTKIGGLPRWIQEPESLPGRFLCALGSLSFSSDAPYPFVNIPEPVGDADLHGPMWGDMGNLCLFLERGEVLHVAVQCY
jgi:hypothetical protein